MRPSLNDALAQSGRRVTGPRQALVELIGEQRGHFTAAELIADARREHIRVGRATVFRTLDLLTEIEALERLDLPSGEHAYVACEPEQHHHHVVCRSCGKSVEVEDSGLQSVVREIARRSGYGIDSTPARAVSGLCPTCAEGAA